MTYASLATYSTYTPSREETERWSREEISRFSSDINSLQKSLAFKDINKRYKFWKDYFVWADEDDGLVIDVDFPKFLDNYEYYIHKELQKKIKDGIRG